MNSAIIAFIKRHWLEQSGWLVSALLHAAILAMFAAWLMPVPTGTVPVALDSRFGETQQAQPFDTSVELALEPDNAALDQLADTQLPAEPPKLLALDDTTGHLGPASLMPGEGILGSVMGNDGTGAGSGFFGVRAAGKTFVYIVDASGSMEGRRFRRARYELNNSLKRLRSHQKFYVIFYNYDAHPMPMTELVTASKQNLQTARKWIADVRPVGPTFPGTALKRALELEPDAIYFLSDGIFDAGIVDAVHQANTAKITIHTICFEDRIGERVLQALAAQNGGKYRFVR